MKNIKKVPREKDVNTRKKRKLISTDG